MGVRLDWNRSARGILIYFTPWLHSDIRRFPFALVLLNCLVGEKYFRTFLGRLQTNVLSGSCHDSNSTWYLPLWFFVFVPLLKLTRFIIFPLWMSYSKSAVRANVCYVSHLFGHDEKDKSPSFSAKRLRTAESKVVWDLNGKRFI